MWYITVLAVKTLSSVSLLSTANIFVFGALAISWDSNIIPIDCRHNRSFKDKVRYHNTIGTFSLGLFGAGLDLFF